MHFKFFHYQIWLFRRLQDLKLRVLRNIPD